MVYIDDMTRNRPNPAPSPSGAESLTDRAYHLIRSGLLPGGPFSLTARLVEREVARKLAMSRTPVRDALRRLEVEGLVERTSNGRYVPRQISFRTISEVFELRRRIEPYATRLAASRADAGAIARVRGTMERADAPDGAFHVALAEASGNAVLARVVSELNGRLAGQRLLNSRYLKNRDPVRPTHAEILSAVERNDERTAGRLMEEHLAAVYRDVVEIIRTTGPSTMKKEPNDPEPERPNSRGDRDR